MLDNSSQIAQSKGMTVSVAQGGLVVIKGNAADADEARLVENMIRLTPGVWDVKNELKY
jgi:osmotically-inducible protein OsmY